MRGSVLCLKRSAVCALRYGRVRFVSDYLDLVKSAVIFVSAVMCALRYRASDGVVGHRITASSVFATVVVLVHFVTVPFLVFGLLCIAVFTVLHTLIFAPELRFYSKPNNFTQAF